MKNILTKLDHQTSKILKDIGQLASELDVRVYLVGGPVRDLLLGKDNLDIDVTVEGNAIRLAEIFGKTHQAKEIVRYQAFKTATVSLSKDQIVDFATARKEVYIRPGAFPTVTPSTIEDDLYRRDFTINAIAISINFETWGKMVDPYGGQADLKAKKIRILHPKSFEDDPTRILRAARFKARLGFTMEKKTLQILEKSVHGGALETIKKQRYRKDLEKILKEPKSKDVIQCLKSWNAYKEEK